MRVATIQCRPCERRDPYAAAWRLAQWPTTFSSNRLRWLWVPAFAGTTHRRGRRGLAQRHDERRFLLRRPPRGLRRLGRNILETTPPGFDFGVGGAVTSRPHLGGRGRIFGDVISNDGAGGAMNDPRSFTGFRLKTKSKANGSNAPPT